MYLELLDVHIIIFGDFVIAMFAVIQLMDMLPLEILEQILLRYVTTTFAVKMAASRDRDVTLMTSAMSHVASVSFDWYMAVVGWQCSSTRKWFRHTVKRLLNRCERNFFYGLRPNTRHLSSRAMPLMLFYNVMKVTK